MNFSHGIAGSDLLDTQHTVSVHFVWRSQDYRTVLRGPQHHTCPPIPTHGWHACTAAHHWPGRAVAPSSLIDVTSMTAFLACNTDIRGVCPSARLSPAVTHLGKTLTTCECACSKRRAALPTLAAVMHTMRMVPVRCLHAGALKLCRCSMHTAINGIRSAVTGVSNYCWTFSHLASAANAIRCCRALLDTDGTAAI
jgi:hypothetical protein